MTAAIGAIAPILAPIAGGLFGLFTQPKAPSSTPLPSAPKPVSDTATDEGGVMAAESAKARKIAQASEGAYKAGISALSSTDKAEISKKTLLGS